MRVRNSDSRVRLVMSLGQTDGLSDVSEERMPCM